jgi:hypothetical protein
LGVVGFKLGKYILRFDLRDNLKKCKWSLLVVYGSAHEEFKNEFLVELSSFCHEVDTPYIIGGDFNIIRHSGEKNKCTPMSKYSDIFNSIIHTLGLREIHMAGGLYTWSIKQKFPRRSWIGF